MSQLPLVKTTVLLVVEDEAIIRMLAAEVLADAGFHVIEAGDADEALDILQTRANGIHGLFTDVHMPGSMNGVELVHEATRCWPWLHLLVASGHAMPTQAELPIACRFLPKPYELSHVVGHLHEMTRV